MARERAVVEIFVTILKVLFVVNVSLAAVCLLLLTRVTYFSESIDAKNKLKITDEERRKLKISDSVSIEVALREDCPGAYTTWKRGRANVFDVILGPNDHTRCAIKHELFHVYAVVNGYKLHEDLEEFLAAVYEVTNLNLLNPPLFKRLKIA